MVARKHLIDTVADLTSAVANPKANLKDGQQITVAGTSDPVTWLWEATSTATADNVRTRAHDSGGTGRFLLKKHPLSLFDVGAAAFGANIKTAVEAAFAAGETLLYVPPTLFNTKDLTLKSYKGLIGENRVISGLWVTGADTGVIFEDTALGYAYSSTLHRLRFRGDTTGTCLYIKNAAHAFISELQIDVDSATAIRVGECVGVYIKDTMIRGAIGVYYETTAGFATTVNNFDICQFWLCPSAFRFDQDATKVVINGGYFDTCTNLIHPDSTKVCQLMTLNDVWFETVFNVNTDHVARLEFNRCTIVDGATTWSGKHPIHFNKCIGGSSGGFAPPALPRAINASGEIYYSGTNFETGTLIGDRISVTNGGIVQGEYATLEKYTDAANPGQYTNLFDANAVEVTPLTLNRADPKGGSKAALVSTTLISYAEETDYQYIKVGIRSVDGTGDFELWMGSGGAQIDYRCFVSNLIAADGWYILTLRKPAGVVLGFIRMRAIAGDYEVFRPTISNDPNCPLLEKGETLVVVAEGVTPRTVATTVSAATGNVALVTAAEFGLRYAVKIAETTAMDGSPKTFRLGTSAGDDSILGDVTATGTAEAIVYVDGAGQDIVLSWVNTAGTAGELTATVKVMG